MPRPFVLSSEQVGQALKMKQGKMKQRDIASFFGLSTGTISRYLNPEKRELHRRLRAENNLRIKVNGKGKWIRLKVKKRPKPDYCELCESSPRGKWGILNWHHWDPEKPELGLWLCPPCHWFVEGVERGLKAERYLELKRIEAKVLEEWELKERRKSMERVGRFVDLLEAGK